MITKKVSLIGRSFLRVVWRALSDVQELMRNHALQADQGWRFYRLRNQCPLSIGHTQSENPTKFYIEKNSGRFVCLHCNRSGNIDDLGQALSQKGKTCRKVPVNITSAAKVEKYATSVKTSDEHHGFSRATLEKYQGRLCRSDIITTEDDLIFPIYATDRTTIIDAVLFGNDHDRCEYPVFGLQTINPRHGEVIVTSSLEDALNAYQISGHTKPCIALFSLPLRS